MYGAGALGKCSFCGKPAGFLRDSHGECHDLHDAAVDKIPAWISGYAPHAQAPADLVSQANDYAKTRFVDAVELRRLVLDGLSRFVEGAVKNGFLTDEEAQKLQTLRDAFGITDDELTRYDAWKLQTLRERYGASDEELNRSSVMKRLSAAGRVKIPLIIRESYRGTNGLSGLKAAVADIAKSHFVAADEVHKLVMDGISQLVDQASDDHMITEDEDRKIHEVRAALDVSVDEFRSAASFLKLVKAGILRDLDSGKTPNRVQLSVPLPVNLQKGETILWIFNSAISYRLKVHTQYVGKSSGWSVQIVGNLYYNENAFRGHPVETTSLDAEATGDLMITNKNVYFLSPGKNYRYGAEQIIAATGCSDGIGISTGSGESHWFGLSDPAFAASIIAKLGRL